MEIYQVVKELKVLFPGIKGVEVHTDHRNGHKHIHMGNIAEGGTVHIDGTDWPAADYYAYEVDPKEHHYTFGFKRELYEAVQEHGFFLEWYDPGTVCAYPI